MRTRTTVTDARRWSRYVGVVADDPHLVASSVQKHGLHQDFELGVFDKQSTLSKLKWEADTDRYVFVGTSKENRAVADHVGWEYIPVEEAAEKADWPLTEDAGILEPVQTRLTRLSPGAF